jgi:NitT/TauT family transport system ATP-binding protein
VTELHEPLHSTPERAPAPDRALPKIVAESLRVSFSTKSGPVHALGPLDLEIAEGEFVCVVGPSGCGKSTFVRVIAGLQHPTSGRVTLRLAGAHVPIATVFQDFGIFPWKTVRGNVEFGLTTTGTSRSVARARADDWLHRLGLRGFESAYPNTLSGGMRQRVAIARALAVEPEILLMDEPFAALDAQMREILQEELLRVCEADRRTVVFVTHSLDEAIVLGDRVIVMTARPGHVLDDRPVPLSRPRDLTVRESAPFVHLRSDLWDHLRDEVQRQLKSQESPE